MNPQQIETLKDAIGNIETALGKLEDVLGSSESALLAKAADGLVAALSHLHEMDPEWLSPKYRERMETLSEKARSKRGRDTFNTGF